MWIVAKIKIREKNIFEQDLRKKVGSKNIFYNPNIEVKQFTKNKFRIVKKSILENYIFCYHDNFKNIKILDNLKFTRGLSFFLKESNLNQRKIIEFHENAFFKSENMQAFSIDKIWIHYKSFYERIHKAP